MSVIQTAALAASMIEDNLTKSGKIGRTEQNVFRFDGNTEGKASLGDLVLVSAKTPDLLTFVRATGVMGGVNVEITADSLTFETSEGESTSNFAFFNDIPIFATVVGSDVEQLPNGLYLFSNDEGYISYIEFAETIHPIDQKYLPGVCLPVTLNLSDYGISLAEVMRSGETIVDWDCSALISDAFQLISQGIVPILLEGPLGIYIVPTSANDLAITMSVTMNTGNAANPVYIKGDAVIEKNTIAMFQQELVIP